MRVITEDTFVTDAQDSITVRAAGQDTMLRIIRAGNGQVVIVWLTDQERQAMINLLQGGTMDIPVLFSRGDLVRAICSVAGSFEEGALARVLDSDKGMLRVEWLDYRGDRNRPFIRWHADRFEHAGELTEQDYISIGVRTARGD